MKKLFLFFIVLLLVLPLCQIPTAKANPGWLIGWDYRVQIDIDSGDIDANLASFPVLIYLSNSSSGIYDEDVSFIFDEIGGNSKKIAVTVGEDIETFVEIEKWDSVNEQAWLWANVTATAASNQTLYLYYDNDHADNGDYVNVTGLGNSVNVWDSDFEVVYHMRDNTTSRLADSTSNIQIGIKKDAGEPAVTTGGEIDDAQAFDGADDFVSSIVDIPSVYTIEGWIYPTTDNGADGIGGGVTQRYAAYIQYEGGVGDDFIQGVQHSGNSYVVTDAGSFPKNEWHYFTYVVNDKYHEIFADGASDDFDTEANSATTDGLYYIGRRNDGRYLPARIDEFRLSSVVRSDSWIKASYESGRDHLLDFGGEVERPVMTVTFYNSTGGILRVNNVTIANGTETEYLNNTELELIAIVEGNMTYGFANFTWNGNYNITNPYNWTFTYTVSNITLWCYFGAITAVEDTAFDGIMWLAVAGLIGAVLGAVVIKKRN